MSAQHLYPRFAKSVLAKTLAFSPLVLTHGTRQFGKCTLASMLDIGQGYAYTSFDDDVMRQAVAGFGEGLYAVPIASLWESA